MSGSQYSQDTWSFYFKWHWTDIYFNINVLQVGSQFVRYTVIGHPLEQENPPVCTPSNKIKWMSGRWMTFGVSMKRISNKKDRKKRNESHFSSRKQQLFLMMKLSAEISHCPQPSFHRHHSLLWFLHSFCVLFPAGLSVFLVVWSRRSWYRCVF